MRTAFLPYSNMTCQLMNACRDTPSSTQQVAGNALNLIAIAETDLVAVPPSHLATAFLIWPPVVPLYVVSLLPCLLSLPVLGADGLDNVQRGIPGARIDGIDIDAQAAPRCTLPSLYGNYGLIRQFSIQPLSLSRCLLSRLSQMHTDVEGALSRTQLIASQEFTQASLSQY